MMSHSACMYTHEHMPRGRCRLLVRNFLGLTVTAQLMDLNQFKIIKTFVQAQQITQIKLCKSLLILKNKCITLINAALTIKKINPHHHKEIVCIQTMYSNYNQYENQ